MRQRHGLWDKSRIKVRTQIWKQNQGISQVNQAARGSQERYNWSRSLWDSHWPSVTQRIFVEADVKEKTILRVEAIKTIRDRRSCKKLEIHVWSVDRFTQTIGCHVLKGPRSPKVSIFLAGAPHLYVYKYSMSPTAFWKLCTVCNVYAKQETWQGFLAANPPTLG